MSLHESEPENEPMNNPKSLTSENNLFLYGSRMRSQMASVSNLDDALNRRNS